MAFLTVNGTDLTVVEGTGQEDAPLVRGKLRQAFAGNWLSTQSTPKRRFTVNADFTTIAALESFVAGISVAGAPGVPKAIIVTSSATTGLTNGATVVCFVTVGARQAWTNGSGLGWTLPLTIQEA